MGMANEASCMSASACARIAGQSSLRRLLVELARQETQGLFTYSVVVVDNDKHESARAVVMELAKKYAVPITTGSKSIQSIPRPRNRAVEMPEVSSSPSSTMTRFRSRDGCSRSSRPVLRRGGRRAWAQ